MCGYVYTHLLASSYVARVIDSNESVREGDSNVRDVAVLMSDSSGVALRAGVLPRKGKNNRRHINTTTRNVIDNSKVAKSARTHNTVQMNAHHTQTRTARTKNTSGDVKLRYIPL